MVALRNTSEFISPRLVRIETHSAHETVSGQKLRLERLELVICLFLLSIIDTFFFFFNELLGKWHFIYIQKSLEDR